MWNRSGLAATLPLQIKTNRGSDFLMQLREAEGGPAILAAYIRGGEFFRVLVPPGRYSVLFVTGTTWKGEVEQFGPGSRRFVLDPPLAFRATISRKKGHLIDLRAVDRVTVRNWAICQRLEFDPKYYLLRPQLFPEEPLKRRKPYKPLRHLGHQYFPKRYEVSSRFCD